MNGSNRFDGWRIKCLQNKEDSKKDLGTLYRSQTIPNYSNIEK